MKTVYFCPKCRDDWNGGYTMFHRCEQCGSPVHVKTEENDND